MAKKSNLANLISYILRHSNVKKIMSVFLGTTTQIHSKDSKISFYIFLKFYRHVTLIDLPMIVLVGDLDTSLFCTSGSVSVLLSIAEESDCVRLIRLELLRLTVKNDLALLLSSSSLLDVSSKMVLVKSTDTCLCKVGLKGLVWGGP